MTAAPLRITFVLAHANISGGVRMVAGFAERLKKRGHKVVVVSVPEGSPTLLERLRSLRRGGPFLPRRTLPSHFDGVEVEHRVVDSVRPIADRDVPDADVVIATWWQTAEWVARLSPSKGAKAYFIQHHEVVFPGQPADRVAATWSLPMQKIVCARWLKDLAHDRYGDPNAIVASCAIDPAEFFAPPRGKRADPTVGLMYSTIPFKGTDVSIGAFKLAASRIRGLRLLAFGYDQVSSALPLPPGATFLHRPAQTKIRECYSSCDAWLFGSRSEGFGLPILEAMACRTPVIATPAGAAPELLSDGGGELVPHEDPKAMAEAIERLVMAPEPQWKEMADRAAASSTRYGWEQSTDRFEAALVSIARPASD